MRSSLSASILPLIRLSLLLFIVFLAFVPPFPYSGTTGVDLATIIARVGHDDERTTLKIYTHVTKKMKKNASEKVKVHFGSILNSEFLP